MTTEPVIDRRRLIRAVKLLLWTERLGPMQFRVKGNDEPEYFVDLDGETPCSCADWLNRGSKYVCKHVLVSRLLNRDEDLMLRADRMLMAIAKSMDTTPV